MSHIILVSLIITIIVAWSMAVGWLIGIKHPAKDLREKIMAVGIRSQLSKWYLNRKWTCVEIINDYPGFMGLPMKAIILESDGERVRFGCYNDKFAKGAEVRLRLRTDEELRSGVWISAVDKFLTPALQGT